MLCCFPCLPKNCTPWFWLWPWTSSSLSVSQFSHICCWGGHAGIADKAIAYTSILYGCWCKFWLPCFLSSSLLLAWKRSKGRPKFLGCRTNVGELVEVPGYWLVTSPVSDIVAIREVNWVMADLLLFLFLCFFSLFFFGILPSKGINKSFSIVLSSQDCCSNWVIMKELRTVQNTEETLNILASISLVTSLLVSLFRAKNKQKIKHPEIPCLFFFVCYLKSIFLILWT